MSEDGEHSDGLMAAAFAEYLSSYREALIIFDQYKRGYQITLIKGHSPGMDTPMYRVIIYKLRPSLDAKGQPDKEYYEWEAEGMAGRLDLAVLEAHKRAQRHLNKDVSM